MMLMVLAVISLSAVSLSSGREVCEEIGLVTWEKRNDNNVVCYNSSDQSHYYVTSLKSSEVRKMPDVYIILSVLYIAVASLSYVRRGQL